MNKEQFKKLLPSEKEKRDMYFVHIQHRETDKIAYDAALFDLAQFILSKLPSLTDAELMAIEEYKVNKLSAVKFLKSENNCTLKEAIDFLEEHTNN